MDNEPYPAGISTRDRFTPASPEAEQAVLGSLLIDPDAIIRVAAYLKAEDFYQEKNGWIYQAVLDLHERREPADFLTVTDELERRRQLSEVGGSAYVLDLINAVPTAIHVEHYARIVERTSVLRKLIRAAGQIAQLAYEETAEDVQEVVDRAEQIIFGVAEQRLHRDLLPVRTIMADVVDRIDHLYRHRGQILGVPTGFKLVDRLLGGLQKSDLIILAARPAMGKTSLALSIAQNAARKYGQRVALFSLEMSSEQLVQRLLAAETGIDSQRLRLGDIHGEEEWHKLMEAAGALSDTMIFIDDTPALSALELRTKARRVHAEHGLDLLVVDYLQLMSGDSRSENRVQEISYISRALKGLARELNLPVLALSQLSRAVESRQDKRPILSDLRESGCLSGESLVYLPGEGRYVPIRDLVGMAGFYVTSLNTETWKLEPGLVTNSFCTGAKPVYRLTTKLGRTIRLTANHKLLTIAGWKRLDKLSTEDRIALPRLLPGPVAQTMSDAELALLGHLIGDGCTLPRHAIQYTTKEFDLANTVAELARQVFGDEVSPRVYKEPRQRSYQVFIPTTRKITHGIRNPVSEWLGDLGVFGLRSYEKYIPSKVFQQPNEAIALFLRHLWSTDGCVRMKKTRTASFPAVYYASSSETLGRDVQSLLLRLGINARLKRIPQNDKGRDQFHLIVTGRPDLDYFVERVSAVGQYNSDSLAAIREHIGDRESKSNRDIIPMSSWSLYAVPAMRANGTQMRRPHSKEITRAKAAQIAAGTGSSIFANLAESDVYWDRVASIEPDGVTDVYDLTVDKNHSFVANDIVMSNSIEQDADVVMFIYREEMYVEDTERQNIADVIVAKHRNGPTGTVSLYFRKELTQFRDLELRREELE